MTLSANWSAEDDKILCDRAVKKPKLTHRTRSDVKNPIFVLADVTRVLPKSGLRQKED
jgi:hypothetical protein